MHSKPLAFMIGYHAGRLLIRVNPTMAAEYFDGLLLALKDAVNAGRLRAEHVKADG